MARSLSGGFTWSKLDRWQIPEFLQSNDALGAKPTHHHLLRMSVQLNLFTAKPHDGLDPLEKVICRVCQLTTGQARLSMAVIQRLLAGGMIATLGGD